MEDKEHLFNESIQLVCSDFEDQKNNLLKNNDFASFHQALTNVIRIMLYNDYNRLINILYKIDVDEKKYTQLFKNLPSDEVSGAIADLIIQRAKQKAEMRKKYKE